MCKKEGFLNNAKIKERIPKEVFKGMDICRENGLNLVVNNEITMPNCTNSSWAIDNITAKNIGKNPFAPYSGFTPGTPVLIHYSRGMPPVK